MTGPAREDLVAALAWLEEREWRGHDPFDGLESRLFLATPLAHWWPARLAWIQLHKRLPINLRALVGVPRLRNPKALGLGLSALARLIGAERDAGLLGSGRRLVGWLEAYRDAATGGWGYPFAWQNRKFYAPRDMPNAVCTAFVVRGLRDWAQASADAAAATLAQDASGFFLDALVRHEDDRGVCFSYTRADTTRIHNVNLLVAACVAEHPGSRREEALELAGRAAAWSVSHQRRDGSWPYGEGAGQGWVDGFHSGFNLHALRRLEAALGAPALGAARRAGYAYWARTFVAADGAPRYATHSSYPFDVHAAAQAILTLLEHADEDDAATARAGSVYDWTRRHLRLAPGVFGYQRRRWMDARIVYARWNQAWMVRALAELVTVPRAGAANERTA